MPANKSLHGYTQVILDQTTQSFVAKYDCRNVAISGPLTQAGEREAIRDFNAIWLK